MKYQDDLQNLLYLEEPTISNSDYRDAHRDEPAFLASKFDSGIKSFYSRQLEAQRRLDYYNNFPSMIRNAVLGLKQADLANLALNARSITVRVAATKRIEDPSIATRVFHESRDASVRACVLPRVDLTQAELIDLAQNNRDVEVQLGAIARVNDTHVLKMLLLGGSDMRTRIQAARSLGHVEEVRTLVRTLDRTTREALAVGLKDQVLLAEWVLEYEDDVTEATKVIHSINDQKLLSDIFQRAQGPLLAEAALKCVKDPRFLATVWATNGNASSRSYAANLLKGWSRGDLIEALGANPGPHLLTFVTSEAEVANELLLHAARRGQRDVAELLLANKAEVSTKDYEGNTPLHLAARYGHLDLAQLLLASNACVNEKDNYGNTPLHFAAGSGHKDIAELLLASKAEVKVEDNDGLTPLQRAVKHGRKGIVELLTPLHRTAADGDLGKVKELLKDNPDLVFTKDLIGQTPLHWAVRMGHKDVAELLLANQAEVGAKNNEGETPLHEAAGRGHRDVAELLLANKAEVNAKSLIRKTPLHCAAKNGHKNVAELLLAHRAEVSAEDKSGNTPLDEAARQGHKEVFSSRWFWFRHYLRKRLECHRRRLGLEKTNEFSWRRSWRTLWIRKTVYYLAVPFLVLRTVLWKPRGETW